MKVSLQSLMVWAYSEEPGVIFLAKSEILLLVPDLGTGPNCSTTSETFHTQVTVLCMIHFHFITATICFHQETHILRKGETPESWVWYVIETMTWCAYLKVIALTHLLALL